MTGPPGAPAIHALATARSLLFVPGDRPERFDKAAASGADLVVLDLEDAVAPTAKQSALEHVVAWLVAAAERGATTVVRVNGVETPTHDAELAALAGTGAALMLPKAESADQLGAVRAELGTDQPLVVLVETARGVRDVDAIAAAEGVARVALGTIDLAAELGVDPTSYAAFWLSRSRVVMACAAAGLPGPVDGVTTTLEDPSLLAEDIAHARELGFTGKLVVHPRQVAAVNTGFAPSDAEVAWARGIVSAADATAEGGVVVVDGAMVDAPVVARARRILDRVP